MSNNTQLAASLVDKALAQNPDEDHSNIRDHMIRHTAEQLDSGWTRSDAWKFLNCTEEVNPELDEDLALFHMEVLTDKYSDDTRKYTGKRMN